MDKGLSVWRELDAGPEPGGGGLEGSEKALTRRRIFRRVVGVAAVGAAGGSLLAEAFPSRASAATAGTTVEPGAVAPAVVSLTDAATIAVNASLGNDFRVTLGGDRTMGTPSNPADGQQIVFQVTQGSGGPFTVSWGSGYEFAGGQPTLSTTAGDTDLLFFVYNNSLSSWLLARSVTGFSGGSGSSPSPSPSPSQSPSPSPSMSTTMPAGTFRLFPTTNGPSSPVYYTGQFLAGVAFEVTTGGCWLDGYWWWVCDSGQPTAAQKFALWQMYSGGVGTPVSGSVVTSGALTAGQWNYVPLANPLPLALGIEYVAATGFTGSFPISSGQFGSGGAYSAGITSGPLFAYSDGSGSAPAPYTAQGTFSTLTSDPTVDAPTGGSGSSNFWMDVQITTSPPVGTSYRLWPTFPVIPGGVSNDTNQQTTGTEFKLSHSCTLDNIWFYSPPGAAVLPSRCAIWDVSSQTVVAGTDNTSPSWSGAAGSGWVACPYSGVTLPAGDYKTTIYSGGGSKFYMETVKYFSSGAGANGITAGPLNCPNTTNATPPGNSTYQNGPFSYPQTFDNEDDGENRWIDVEVTPTG